MLSLFDRLCILQLRLCLREKIYRSSTSIYCGLRAATCHCFRVAASPKCLLLKGPSLCIQPYVITNSHTASAQDYPVGRCRAEAHIGSVSRPTTTFSSKQIPQIPQSLATVSANTCLGVQHPACYEADH